MIEFKQGRYFLGLWFIAWEIHDMVITVYTDGSPVGSIIWDLQYRVRYYDPDDPGNEPFSGKDHKSGYSGRSERPLTEEKVFDNINTLVNTVCRMARPRNKSFCPLYTSDPKIAMELIQKQPWAHMKQMSKEEYEKEYGKGEQKDD